MQTITHFFVNLFTWATPADASTPAGSLLERAAQSRGMSAGDAAQLRINALAMLSVVR